MSVPKCPCPICKKAFISWDSCAEHFEKVHSAVLAGKHITAKQYIFNVRNRLDPFRRFGKSILSGKPTKWNETTGKYERLADNTERQQYRKMFVDRMMKTYGRATLLDDPEVQKKMLANRKISGKYVWSDGSREFTYTGSYEEDCLRFLDELGIPSAEVFAPAPFVVSYKSPRDDKEHFYIPDVYIGNLKIVIEVKSAENKHYRARDLDIEKAKDFAMSKRNLTFVKVYDKDYTELGETIKQAINQ